MLDTRRSKSVCLPGTQRTQVSLIHRYADADYAFSCCLRLLYRPPSFRHTYLPARPPIAQAVGGGNRGKCYVGCQRARFATADAF